MWNTEGQNQNEYVSSASFNVKKCRSPWLADGEIFSYIPYSLIFKLKDSKDSNSVCHKKCIRNQWKEVHRSHLLSWVTSISITLSKISERPHPLFKTVFSSNLDLLRGMFCKIENGFYSLVCFHSEYLRTQKLGNFVFYIKRQVWADKVLKSRCGHSEILGSVIEIDVN